MEKVNVFASAEGWTDTFRLPPFPGKRKNYLSLRPLCLERSPAGRDKRAVIKCEGTKQ